MNPVAIITLITTILQLSPLAIQTITGVKNLLAADPNIPQQLTEILKQTADDNAATLAMIEEWMATNTAGEGTRRRMV